MSMEVSLFFKIFAVCVLVVGAFMLGAWMATADRYCVSADSQFGMVVVCDKHPANVEPL